MSTRKTANITTLLEKKCSCKGDIHYNDKHVTCCYCKTNHHIECVGVNNKEYHRLIADKCLWFCGIDCKNKNGSGNTEEVDIPENPSNKDIFIMLKEVRTSQKHMSDNNDELIENVRQLTEGFKKLKEENEMLKARILMLESKKATVEVNSDQDNLITNVVLSGIPNSTSDLPDAIIKIASALDEELKFLPNQILSVERLFVQSDNTPENKIISNIPVVVKFDAKETKMSFMKALKNKKDLISDEAGLEGSHKIFGSDHLTPGNFKIIRKARALRYKGVIKHAWIQNSTVLIREKEDSKIVAIRNIYELNQYDKVDSSIGSSG